MSLEYNAMYLKPAHIFRRITEFVPLIFALINFVTHLTFAKIFLAVENVFKFRIHKLNQLQTITICNYGLKLAENVPSCYFAKVTIKHN